MSKNKWEKFESKTNSKGKAQDFISTDFIPGEVVNSVSVFSAWGKEKPNKIVLNCDDEYADHHKVLSIKVTDNNVIFREECDGYFERNTTIPEAKQILLDALAFVESFEVTK